MLRRLCFALAIPSLFALPACTESVGGESSDVEVSAPAHPAMSRPPSTTVEPHDHAAHAGGSASGLPAGHPPVGSSRAAPPPPSSDRGGARAAPASGPVEVLGMTFEAPEGWVSEPPASSMRLAQYRIPHAEGDATDGELTVIPSGGSIPDNIRRWKDQQFQGASEPVVEQKTVGGVEVTTVVIEGTFLLQAAPMAGGRATPMPDYRLWAAIAQAPGGQIFFKAVGPNATLEKEADGFASLVESFQAR